jgi:gamma-glutamyltranspeptidase/glutathione hydrolase
MWYNNISEETKYVISKKYMEKPVAKNGMVAAKHPLGALAGLKTLEKGGNAIDAAIATNFALAVVEPFMTGLGGGGRCVIRLANGETYGSMFETMTPGRENPFQPDPERKKTMYGVELNQPACKNDENLYGYKASAIPGFVKGMCQLADKYGTMNLEELLKPAIKYAEKGFIIDTYLAKTIAFDASIIAKFPETAKTLLKNGFPPKPYGWSQPREPDFPRLVQKDLASTLRKIARDGADAFYKGEIAQAIVEDMEANGGYITEEDLRSYEPEVYEVSQGSYRGYDLLYLPVHTQIVQILNLMENFDMKGLGYNSTRSIHVFLEAIKLAFKGREKFLGLGLEEHPLQGIVSKEYAEEIIGQVGLREALKGFDLGDPWVYQEENTTHACVVDKERNIVGVHNSIGNTFGCKVTVKGTGIILNNKMSPYDPRPGMPMSVIPHKLKPGSSSSIVVVRDGDPFMVIGSPGGYKQVTAVARCISNIIDYGMSIQDAIDAPRLYVEREKVFLESSMPPGVCDELAGMGHDLVVVDKEFGFAQPNGIVVDAESGLLYGGADKDLDNGLDGFSIGLG